MNDLRLVFDHLYAKPTDKAFLEFAGILSKIAGQLPSWKVKYMKGCYYGYKNISPSKSLTRALQILANQLDGQSELQARARPVIVLAINGTDENSIILGHTIRCQYCQIKFVPTVPWQKYCCVKHKRKYYRSKKNEKI